MNRKLEEHKLTESTFPFYMTPQNKQKCISLIILAQIDLL